MRKELKNRDGQREMFHGTFDRFGTKPNWHGFPEKTVLLVNVTDANGNRVSDHLWFNLTKQFEALDLQHGDLIEFHARVKKYEKGYFGYREDVYKPLETDYKLSYPTKIKILRRELAA